MMIYLGAFYWAEQIGLDDIIANDFKHIRKTKGVKVISRDNLCDCGNCGAKIVFDYKGQTYRFNFLTGYPCQRQT